MELHKDKEFQQEVEAKNIDPEIGLEINLDISKIDTLIDNSKLSKSEEKDINTPKDPIDSLSEIKETEELFHGGLLDFETEEFTTDLHFETEDLLPESIVHDEIIKLLEEEINFDKKEEL